MLNKVQQALGGTPANSCAQDEVKRLDKTVLVVWETITVKVNYKERKERKEKKRKEKKRKEKKRKEKKSLRLSASI